MKKAAKAILWICALLAFAWVALSAYFVVAGRDSQGDCFCEYTPDIDYWERVRDLPPDENAFTHLKWLSENMPTNKTLLYTDYRLKTAFLSGTTNRLALADAAREFIAAESNTFACAERLLKCKVLHVQKGEIPTVSSLVRIAAMSRVKAVLEAAEGDVAKGRQTLMDVAKIGLLAMSNESYSVGLSQQVGYSIAKVACETAAEPLFDDGDDTARENLRECYRELIANDAANAKRAAMREINEYWCAFGENCSTNPTSMFGAMLYAGRMPWGNVWLEDERGNILPDTALADTVWQGVERQFVAVLLTAFPGYAQYALQSNRRLDAHRKECARFCQKIDEPYDIQYAREVDFGWRGGTREKAREINPLHRNWLGEIMMDTTCYGEKYMRLFKQRFEIAVRIAASACQSYKAKYGEFPADLPSLVPEFLPEVPRDPYDGKPLRYNSDRLFFWTPGEKLSFDGKVTFSRDGRPLSTPSMLRCVYFIPNPETTSGATSERRTP